MNGDDERSAWGAFWKAESRRGNGCLPNAWQGIDGVQGKTWSDFARELKPQARVLDLGTGDGRVLGYLLAVSSRFRLQGVDLAPTLPPPPRGTKTQGGVAMEALPFEDHSFDAVTAQFALEYGDIRAVVAEIARVLRPAGQVGLIMHRGDGPILAHNMARRDAIRWAIEEQELVERAKKSLALRALGQPGIPPLFQQSPARGAEAFGSGSAAWEIAEAVRQTLGMGIRDHPANVAATLDQIGNQARNELGRIASLENACATADDHAAVEGAFEAAGLTEVSCAELSEPGRASFAHFRVLRHAG